ncbi:facilitated trehalose transporter Tret1-2 homolog isoform X2 [Periplaneta americana]|uniref:facilitated trehalose transporter Tret1-2 homolog isoform X2 n=1 Tax=Periplaneta americana TaxID=6978 RepID=UPI0037E71FE6
MTRGAQMDLQDVGEKPPPGPEVHPLIENLADVPTTEFKRPEFSPLLRQVLAAAGPMAAITSSGMTTGFSAVLLPQLERPDSIVKITLEQASWIASMAALPMALGCALGGWMMERFGRRTTHQLVCVPYVLGWVLLSLARNLVMLYVGRFLTGLCLGLIGPLSPVYIAEISGPAYRGALLATVSLAVSMGILAANLLGTFLSWQLTAAICAVFPLICYVGIFWVPESPAWLAARGRSSEAEEAFHWFRGYSTEAETELRELLRKHETGRPQQTWVELWQEIRKSSFLRPFLVMNGFFLVMQFSGVNAVAFYTVSILKDVGQGLDEYLATNIIGVVRVVMSLVACVLTRRYDRRPLAVVSCLGTAASLVGLGAFLLSGPSAGWVPLLFFVAYICSVSVGLVPLPWVMVGEVFPAAARGFGSGASSCFCFLVFFAVVKTGPALIAGAGPHGAFFTYGAVAIVGAVVLYLFLPETRNRTLQDIEEGYSRTRTKVNALI